MDPGFRRESEKLICVSARPTPDSFTNSEEEQPEVVTRLLADFLENWKS